MTKAKKLTNRSTFRTCMEGLGFFSCMVCLFVTEATQYCVHGGLQQIKGSYANPLSRINVTTSYEYEASLH